MSEFKVHVRPHNIKIMCLTNFFFTGDFKNPVRVLRVYYDPCLVTLGKTNFDYENTLIVFFNPLEIHLNVLNHYRVVDHESCEHGAVHETPLYSSHVSPSLTSNRFICFKVLDKVSTIYKEHGHN